MIYRLSDITAKLQEQRWSKFEMATAVSVFRLRPRWSINFLLLCKIKIQKSFQDKNLSSDYRYYEDYKYFVYTRTLDSIPNRRVCAVRVRVHLPHTNENWPTPRKSSYYPRKWENFLMAYFYESSKIEIKKKSKKFGVVWG